MGHARHKPDRRRMDNRVGIPGPSLALIWAHVELRAAAMNLQNAERHLEIGGLHAAARMLHKHRTWLEVAAKHARRAGVARSER